MKLTLVDKKEEVAGTKSFFFKPEKSFTWLAGQHYDFTLPKLKFPDERGATRHFTISSSPTEGEIIRITTRVREESGFKKTLDALPMGVELEGRGPSGVSYFDENSKGKHVFLAGGIGITLPRTMIKFALDKSLPTEIDLIYSSSTPDDVIFKKELEEWAKKYPNFKLKLVITSVDGRISQKMLKDMDKNQTWWISGPPAFVDAMEEILDKLKIDSDNIKSEKFTGY